MNSCLVLPRDAHAFGDICISSIYLQAISGFAHYALARSNGAIVVFERIQQMLSMPSCRVVHIKNIIYLFVLLLGEW